MALLQHVTKIDAECAISSLWRVQNPTDSPLLEGRWRLLFTTRPGSASPIQKTFVGVESFTVYQEVLLTSSEGARVNNIVDFGAKIGTLKVLSTWVCHCLSPKHSQSPL